MRNKENNDKIGMTNLPAGRDPGFSSDSETVEVEFEFILRVPPKAASNCLVGYGQPHFSLFVYICKLLKGKKPPLIDPP